MTAASGKAAVGPFYLSGRVSVVTGGTRGIGHAVACALADCGATVVIVGRVAERARQGAAEIARRGVPTAGLAADVADEASVARLAQDVIAQFGPPHVLVNGAGINPVYKAAEKTTLREWDDIIGVNLTGTFLTCREFGRQMVAEGRGSIVNISSIAGRLGLARSAPYCASKGGVEMLSRALALDWAKSGVRVNTVAPGYVATDLTRGLREHPVLSERVKARTPMGRFAEAEEIAGAVVYLASDASRYVTGQTIGVDGGWTAG